MSHQETFRARLTGVSDERGMDDATQTTSLSHGNASHHDWTTRTANAMPFPEPVDGVNPTELTASSADGNYSSDDMSFFPNGVFYDGRPSYAVQASNAAAGFYSTP